MDGGVRERELAYENFATRSARTRIDSSFAAVNRFGMFETAVVAVAVFAVVDDVASVLPDELSTIGATTVHSSRAARFG